MDAATATQEATRLLGDIAAPLSYDDWEGALEGALIPDADGAQPGTPNYVPTYDPWLTAAEAADLLAIRAMGSAGVLKWTSEGTTVERRAADFAGMANALRKKSAATTANTGLSVIKVDNGDEQIPYLYAGVGGGYWTWDTDIPLWYGWRS